jgi:hypothetical protein
MYRIQINGEEVELNQKTRIILNKMILDLEDFANRGINFTNAFTLPFTAKNDRLTGYPSRLASNNQAFEENQTYLLLDEFGIISRGDVVIKSFDDKKGIKIQLAEGFGFWALAGRKLLSDLDLHGQDFVFTTANMNARKPKSTGVFVTALHSATGATTDTALNTYQYTRPTYYFRRVLNEIVAELGYELDYSNTLELTELDFIGCLSNTKDFFVSDLKYRIQDVTNAGDLDISAGTPVFTKAGNVSLSVDTLTNNLYKTGYVIKGWVQSDFSTQINFNFNGNIERVLVPKGRSFINFKTDAAEIGSSLVISTSTSVYFEDVYIYSAISEGDIFDIEAAINITDYLVLADYNLPQHTYKQFIKNLFKLCFLTFDIDENTKKITLSYIPSQVSSNGAVNLSGSVERYYEVKSGSVYGQLNSMSYDNDEDVGVNLGTLFFNVENKNAKESKDFLSVSEFSASREVTATGLTFVTVQIYNTVESKREAVKDRIIYLDEVGGFGVNATFAPLGWSRLYSNHYVSFIEATKRERTSVLSAKITTLQYRSIQKRPVIYVDFLNANFFVSEISDFDNVELCKLTVIKFG